MNKSKTLALLLSLSMLFSACGSNTADKKAGDKADTKVEEATGEATGEGTAKGHNGDLKAVVTFEGDKIAKIDLTHEETEGLGDKAADKLVEEIIANNSINVDTVSGATVTSTALIEAVKAAIEASGRDVKNYEGQVEKAKGETTEKDVDVVVVGGGGAGFAAAVSAKEAGANVVLLEKLSAVGGNTLISGGEYAAPANELQEKEGIEDSKEKFAEDVEKAGGNPELIKVLADKATEDAYWLRDDIGVKWLDSLMFFGGHSVKRSLIPAAHTGNELIKNYTKKCQELGIEVITEADVKEILAKDGKVCGVKAETKDGELLVNAKSVVLASGGFGANAEMCYENDKEVDEHVLSTNSPGATGDGITMAEKLGADTVDMDKIQLYPVCDVETGKLLYCGDTRLVGGALLVNKEGKRFVEELGTRREISMAIKAQTDYVGYVLWDETSNEKTGTMASNPEEAKSLFDRGLMVKADTLEELADHFGIDKDALLETVKTFNENSAKEEDPDFNLRMLGWQVKDAPFYMMKAAPAVHHTMGGLKINTEAKVLNKDGQWIEGLYAAGEVTGGIHGENRLGSVAMTDITVFGKIAGENAAANAKN
ncbi:flavocytochrome c [Anaerococcus sp. NML200537]|uniref:flavocytochrome c n=1 Tax=Anaerococcus sp. NML200537 TaxID=2954485 RepID=UPI002237078D|nr:flavocytochrome c [Anaerococcus sp. NML200537]MCW6701772.1 flavocytochrome c [Anaerococcus sp. NML200537]